MPRAFLHSYLGLRFFHYRDMLSRLVDISFAAFHLGGVKWTVSWILVLSVSYTYFISKLSSNDDPLAPDEPPLGPNLPKKAYLAHARRLRAAQLQVEEERRRISASQRPFRLLDLPPELSLLILAHCASWPPTYVALVGASKHCQRLTFHACLPLIPIRLITPEQVQSFDALLRARPRLAALVHHLWVTPLQVEHVPTAVSLVQKCRNLHSLATNAYIVQEAIIFVPAPAQATGAALLPPPPMTTRALTHRNCKELTLLTTSIDIWALLLATPNGLAFFQQLTRLRLIGDRVSMLRQVSLPSLTYLSYGSTTSTDIVNDPTVSAMLEDRDPYPVLRTVILTKQRHHHGGLRLSRFGVGGAGPGGAGASSMAVGLGRKQKERGGMWLVELPVGRTELELWCDNAYGRGLWERCADPAVG